MKTRAATSIFLAAMLLICVGSQGCATRTTETTVSRPDSYGDSESSSTTTTTTVTTADEPDSVLGATLHAVGEVILFPFRLVGDAVELIV
ncbi:MAG TPA: hypothetical protein VEU51_08190 [Candidatus Acidoferrales bacterium]|nr:hypothetical protein [Candidatus Acidoferrales bacterium]